MSRELLSNSVNSFSLLSLGDLSLVDESEHDVSTTCQKTMSKCTQTSLTIAPHLTVSVSMEGAEALSESLSCDSLLGTSLVSDIGLPPPHPNNLQHITPKNMTDHDFLSPRRTTPMPFFESPNFSPIPHRNLDVVRYSSNSSKNNANVSSHKLSGHSDQVRVYKDL